jgi:hypothetical protein
MPRRCAPWGPWTLPATVLGLLAFGSSNLYAACCYFSAKNADILQPAQKVFITWDPVKKIETFTVQPKFEGNARDFGMVIPTPAQPKLDEMPRDFFTSLAVFSILKYRQYPESKLLPLVQPAMGGLGGLGGGMGGLAGFPAALGNDRNASVPKPPPVKIVESGVVGSLDYKILEATRADELFKWLRDNNYHYAGDEATLNFYVQKKWVFTVMKIDTMQMKKGKDGTYEGEVTPTRFRFSSDKLVYPLKITQISVKDKTEALFYIQAPQKMDLAGDFTYQYTWVPTLQAARGCTPGGLPGRGSQWLNAIKDDIEDLLQRAKDCGFEFQRRQRPEPNAKGQTPTVLEWARRLQSADIDLLRCKVPFAAKVPNVDDGFTAQDIQDKNKGEAVARVIRNRLAQLNKLYPNGFLTREAPEEAVRQLQTLVGHLQAGLFITKFRKTFTRGEMNDDLEIVIAMVGKERDSSQYEEILPSSPP